MEHEMSDRFIANMLARNGRGEDALIDQLFNSSEKRLARTLLLLPRYGTRDVRPLHRKYAGTKRSRRGCANRPTLQLQRETAGTYSTATRPIWHTRCPTASSQICWHETVEERMR